MTPSTASRGPSLAALAPYGPLLSLVAVSILAGLAIARGSDDFSMRGFMHAQMGVFLLVFALLKLFDLEGFAKGFAKYDLLAARSRAYALAYPFLELGLALAYLSFTAPVLVYATTIALFGFGALGVIRALNDGLSMTCPCMGNILSVPLSTVTLTEDLAMVAMAATLLATTLLAAT